METKLALTFVKYWDEIDAKMKEVYALVQGATLTDVAEEVENFYGAGAIDSCKIWLMEEGPFVVSEDFAASIIKDYK